MKIALTVQYTDGETRDVTARFADFVSFERTWSRSVANFEREIRLTDLAWLAWSAETRLRNTTLKFDPDWIQSVENVEMADDSKAEEGGSPLETTVTTG
jgi:hypothetical protein